MTRFSILFRLSFLFGSICLAQAPTAEPLRPLRTDQPPLIDGKLDDAVWQIAPYVTHFRTFIPDFGRVMPESTVAYMAYDDDNLYFAFHCFDPDPSLIKATVTSRDNIRPEDWVCINLDSFNDQQTLYCFYVNPYGIQGDSRFAAGVEDYSLDLIWYSSGLIGKDGYTIEIQIPLKSIRYSMKEPVTMGVFFERQVSRRAEHVSYPELDPKKGYAFLTEMAPMVYPGIKPFSLLEILPAETYSRKFSAPAGTLVSAENIGKGSLTAKYGITSDLILDATYNPDFSQIEADAGQVDINLRYPLFYAEKRPFFLEGNENFGIAATNVFANDVLTAIVHTRTVVQPLVGVKLTGKVTPSSTIATLYAVDVLDQENPLRRGRHVQIPIARYKQALGGDNYLGAIYTARELDHSFNRVAGSDGALRLSDAGTVEYYGFLSQTRPADSASTLNGHAFSLVYKHNSRDLDMDFGSSKVSENFTAETGFLTRTGIFKLNGLVRPKFYPSLEAIRRVDVEIDALQTRDEFSSLWETYDAVTMTNYFSNALNLRFRYFYSTEIFLGQRFLTGGELVSTGGQVNRWLYLTLQYRNANSIYYSTLPFQGNEQRATADIIFQPSDVLTSELTLTYSKFLRDSDNTAIYDYPISRLKLVYQPNKYLFFRGITQYNKYRRSFLTDFLASFTYIPGTVVFFGYGSLYERSSWNGSAYVDDDSFLEFQRGFFVKVSYLWRI